MGVFDGEIYRIRARWDDDRDLTDVTVYTGDPAGYFEGLAASDLSPDHALVHHLNFVVSETEYSFGDYYEEADE